MDGFLKFHSDKGKGKGILYLFVLHSLKEKPKSGYELLKEIKEKTEGMWKPSKGTLYPILNSMEEEKLIKLSRKGKREKNIFELTKKGKEKLAEIKECKKEFSKKILHFRSIMHDIFGVEKKSLRHLMLEIRQEIEEMPESKKQKAEKILEKALEEIKKW
jgi:DNA-binding PadR family transcriptional regulator